MHVCVALWASSAHVAVQGNAVLLAPNRSVTQEPCALDCSSHTLLSHH